MEPSHTLGLILLVVTGHGHIDPDHPTGLWLEEFAVPYEVFTEAGYEVVVASPDGGEAPVDPRSMPESPSKQEQHALDVLETTAPLSEAKDRKYDAVFFAGGHGTMFDFPTDDAVRAVVEAAFETRRPIGLVCHGPAALTGAKTADGEPVARGRTLTGFTNEEEQAVGLVEEMPFLLETRLKEQGARFVSVKTFEENVVVDGNLVTGQNPPSSRKTAQKLLEALGE